LIKYKEGETVLQDPQPITAPAPVVIKAADLRDAPESEDFRKRRMGYYRFVSGFRNNEA
jgi:hypothetical protein